MDPLPFTTLPALPGATADSGVRGRFPEASEGRGAPVEDRDGFEAALQAAGAAGSVLLTAGPAQSLPANRPVNAGSAAGTASVSSPDPTPGAGPVPPAPPPAGDLEPDAFLKTMDTISSPAIYGERGQNLSGAGSAQVTAFSGTGGVSGVADTSPNARVLEGATGGTAIETGSKVRWTAVPTETGAAGMSVAAPGAGASSVPPVGWPNAVAPPADRSGAAVATAGGRALEIAAASAPPRTASNGEPLIDAAGRIVNAAGRVVGVLSLEAEASPPPARSVSVGTGVGRAAPVETITSAVPLGTEAVTTVGNSRLEGAVAGSTAGEPGTGMDLELRGPDSPSRDTRPTAGSEATPVPGTIPAARSTMSSSMKGATPVATRTSAPSVEALPAMTRGGADSRGTPEPGLASPLAGRFTGDTAQNRTPSLSTATSSEGEPGVAGAASNAAGSAVAASAGLPAPEATTPRMSMAGPGRAIELAYPVSPSDLPAAVPQAVKLALRDGVREVRIRLRPPELGGVLVRLRISGNEVTARIEAERSDVRGLLASMRPELGRGMEAAGLKLTSLEVGSMRPGESSRAWETAIQASAAGSGGTGGMQERQSPGGAAGSPVPFGTFHQGGPGQRGEHPARERAGNGRDGAGYGPESRSDGAEAGLVTRGARGGAAIDAWA
jgi:hypothetical protein